MSAPIIAAPAAVALVAVVWIAALHTADVRADAPDIDQQRAHGQFGVTACALVSQAAFDASMTRGWYVDAARLLRQCGRVMAARSAESKARRARKGAFD